jgi:MFS family permease
MTQRDGLSSQEPMALSERRAALSLATLFFFRMFGLFLVLPVLALHAQHLAGATPFLIGVAMGVYGLTQALFQIPFGGLSDRYGRKPVIAAGLLIFGLGSVLCAVSGHVAGIIAGRALQGSGAISAAVMALAADLTREEQRIKVMAVIGVTIGLAFAAAFVAGPTLDAVIGLHGLFWLAAGLALGGLAVLYLFVPEPAHSAFHRECEPQWGQVLGTLANRDLRRLNVGIGCLHFLLTASFVVLPVVLRDGLGLASPSHWQVYLPVFGLSIVLMVPAIRAAQQRGREVFLGAVALVGVSELGLALGHGSGSVVFLMLWGFFSGFNYLEASLPALVSQMAPADRRGTALGVYAMSQFLGTFAGGAFGGLLSGYSGATGVFLMCAALALSWLAYARGMVLPRPLRSHVVKVGRLTAAEATALTVRLAAVAGVSEAVVVGEDGVAFLKVDRDTLDWQGLRDICEARS